MIECTKFVLDAVLRVQDAMCIKSELIGPQLSLEGLSNIRCKLTLLRSTEWHNCESDMDNVQCTGGKRTSSLRYVSEKFV